jgi:hypothetical protein
LNGKAEGIEMRMILENRDANDQWEIWMEIKQRGIRVRMISG